MTFALGKTSEANLLGVQPKLICAVRYAIKRTTQDFGVHEGLRSLERQKKLVASGASRTLDSYHLDGFAVDLVPYIDGRLQWQPGPCLVVAKWMLHASHDLAVRLVWGAVWDRELGSLNPDDLDGAVDQYVLRYKAAHPGKKPLIDMPHFQLVRGQ